jgi:ABC-type multidrug transport system fused ATPase/permease subunit
VLLVAHRPAALRAADRVLVFDSGKLVEQGNYRDLLHQGGTFAEVFRSSRKKGGRKRAKAPAAVGALA